MLESIKLIGTSHISKDSITKINTFVKEYEPDIIAVELDRRRYFALMQSQDSKSSISDVFKVGLSGFLFLLIGRYVQKKLGASIGMQPGADMKYAIDICKQSNLILGLVDRDIEITLKRFSKKFSFKEKLRLTKDLLFAPFSKKKFGFDISKIPKNELIIKILKEVKKSYPNIYSVLIDERNKFMAKKLFKMQRDHKDKKILCIVGAGHVEGMEKELKKLYYSNISF
ncbi:TraB family protein [Bacteroidota bacterium]